MDTFRLPIIFDSELNIRDATFDIKRASIDMPSLEFAVHYASAEYTPNKVKRIANDYIQSRAHKIQQRKPWISQGSSFLTSVLRNYASMGDLVICIPDEKDPINANSTLVSTINSPIINPIISVGINSTYAALAIGERFITNNYEKVILISNKIFSDKYISEKDKILNPLEQMVNELDNLGIKSEQKKQTYEIMPSDLVITIYNPIVANRNRNDFEYDFLRTIDRTLVDGAGVQIVVLDERFQSVENLNNLMKLTQGLDATGFVSQGYNAAFVAASMMRKNEVLTNLVDNKNDTSNYIKCVNPILYNCGVFEVLK